MTRWTTRRSAHSSAGGTTGNLATSFELRASDYARLRPGYPAQALDAAVPKGAVRVLDLAAGTGKLTGPLLNRGYDVIAVEPLPSMLAELRLAHPGAQAVAGTAEELPLAAGAVDSVVVGQAFHWFDHNRAMAGVARVLRPGGTLALLWNHDDEADPLVRDVEAALDRIGRPAGGSTGLGKKRVEQIGVSAGADRSEPEGPMTDPAASGTPVAPFSGHPQFHDPELIMVRWRRRMTVDDFIALQHTYSYVIRASDRLRAQLDSELPVIIRGHIGSSPIITVPVICLVWRTTCR